MLRTLAALLVAANLLFFAWARGWLAPALLPPHAGEREPQRLAAQIAPETVRVIPPQAASAATACIEAGPFAAADVAAAEAALGGAGVAADGWQRREVAQPPAAPAQWLRVVSADSGLQQRLAELPLPAGARFERCRE